MDVKENSVFDEKRKNTSSVTLKESLRTPLNLTNRIAADMQ